MQQAAEVLGSSVDAVRSRIRRGSLDSEKGEDGRVYVWLGDDSPPDEPQGQVEGSRELVDVLRAQVEDLQGRLDREQDANRENRRIIAALTSRIPEIEAPAGGEARGGDLSAEEGPEASTPPAERAAQEEARRPWWRRVFGP